MSSTTETKFDRDEIARGYARRHFETDAGVEEIYHLPKNAPPREIRFLEVNRLIAETTPLEPIDFGVAIGETVGHTLVVLDVTPGQWEAIRKGTISLPAGWTLENAETFARR